MVSICHQRQYYSIWQVCADFNIVGKDVAGIIHDHPDPAEWRRLIERATFIRLRDDVQPDPPDEAIEGVRQFVVSDEWLKSSYSRMMTREAYDVPGNVDEELLPEMIAILEDPAQFLQFCREDYPGGCRDEPSLWDFLASGTDYCFRTLFFRLLELGFFVFSYEPSPNPPTGNCNLFREFIYMINLDFGLCYMSCAEARGRRIYEMQRFPSNWHNHLLIPRGWIDVAYAYTPTVKSKVLAEFRENLLWGLALDKVSSPGCEGFLGAMKALELVQEFLFKGKVDGDLYKVIMETLEVSDMKIPKKPRIVERKFEEEKEHAKKHGGLLALKLALRAFPRRVPSPLNENSVTEGCYMVMNKVADNPKLMQKLGSEVRNQGAKMDVVMWKLKNFSRSRLSCF